MGGTLKKGALFAVVYFSFFCIVALPVVYTFGMAIFVDSTFDSIIQLFEKATIYLLIKSCGLAFSVALLSTFFGCLFGFVLYKTNISYASFFKIVMLVPLLISPYIFAVAWKDLIFLVFGYSGFAYSFVGVVFVLTIIYTPLSMLIVGSALSNIDAQLEESGFVITSPRSVVLKVLIPLVKPALVTSFVLVFIFSISEFSVPAFFGVKVFTTEIFTQFSAFYNHTLAILQSALLVFLCILLLFSEKKYIAEAPFFSIGQKGTSSKKYILDKKSRLIMLLLLAWLLVSICLPFGTLFVQAFREGTSRFFQAFDLLLPTFGQSLGLAFLGAMLIVFVGFVGAYGVKSRSGKSFDWLLLIVFSIPSTILGISLIGYYNSPRLDFIYSSYMIILIAYVGKFSFIAVKLIGNAMAQIPQSLDEIASVQGVSAFSRVRKLLIPMILPTLFVTFVIGFIFCLGELGTTILVYPPGTEIMPIKVFTIMANAPSSLTSSMTLIVFSITLLLIGVFYLIGSRFVVMENK